MAEMESNRYALAEALSVFAMIMLYIWRLRSSYPFSWTIILALMLGSHALRRETPAKLGFGLKNLADSLVRFTPVVLLLSLGIGVIFFILLMLIGVFAAAAGIAGGGVAGSIGLVTVMVLGAIGLIVALLYASARFALAIPACVLERLGPVDAIRRSLALTRGSALRLVLVTVLTAAVYYGLSAVFSIPYLFAMMRMFSTKNFAGLTPYLMLQYVGVFIASSLASPLAAIAVTLIYYDERVRKEAFDLQWMMVLMGGQSQQPAQQQPPAQEPPPPEETAVTPPAIG